MALWVYAVHTLRVMKQTIHDNNHNKNENCNSSAVLLLERRTWELGCRAPQVGAEGPGKAMKRQTSICPGSAHRHRPGEKYESLKKKKHSGPPPSSWARSSWSLWRRRYAVGIWDGSTKVINDHEGDVIGKPGGALHGAWSGEIRRVAAWLLLPRCRRPPCQWAGTRGAEPKAWQTWSIFGRVTSTTLTPRLSARGRQLARRAMLPPPNSTNSLLLTFIMVSGFDGFTTVFFWGVMPTSD